MTLTAYDTYIIHTDGRETKVYSSLWKAEAIERADAAKIGRNEARVVVVKWNNIVQKDELVYEAL